MSYPSRLLTPNESVVVELHPHWSVLAKPAGAVAVMGGAAVAALFLLPGMPFWVAGLLVVAIAVPFAWFGGRWVQRATTSFVVTTERVALRGGVVVKKGWDIRLERINDVSFEQSFTERIFGVGDLAVDTGGEAGMKGMARMPHPDAVKSLIFEKQEDLRNAPAGGFAQGVPGVGDPGGFPGSSGAIGTPRAYAGGGLSVAEQIEKLDELRSRGVVTDEEFEAEKSRLFGL